MKDRCYVCRFPFLSRISWIDMYWCLEGLKAPTPRQPHVKVATTKSREVTALRAGLCEGGSAGGAAGRVARASTECGRCLVQPSPRELAAPWRPSSRWTPPTRDPNPSESGLSSRRLHPGRVIVMVVIIRIIKN